MIAQFKQTQLGEIETEILYFKKCFIIFKKVCWVCVHDRVKNEARSKRGTEHAMRGSMNSFLMIMSNVVNTKMRSKYTKQKRDRKLST